MSKSHVCVLISVAAAAVMTLPAREWGCCVGWGGRGAAKTVRPTIARSSHARGD